MKRRACAVAGLLLGALALGAGTQPVSPPSKPARIAVIPKGTTHVFWKGVERGARKAGEEFKAEVIWKGPVKENDRAQQIQLVQQFIAQGVDGIVLAPLDHKALVAPVREAKRQGIAVVIFDSALEGEAGQDYVNYVATHNREAGKLGGEKLAGLIGERGDVVVFRYQVGSASTDQRETGAIEAVKAAGLTVSVDNRYAGPTAGEAKTAALNMIDQVRKADGVFAPNESSTLGMLLALRQEGLAGTVRFVGFDSSPPLVEALRAGEIDALVVQDPQTMGYKGVESIVKHLRGEAVEKVIDTGAVVVTKENIDDPEVKKLIE